MQTLIEFKKEILLLEENARNYQGPNVNELEILIDSVHTTFKKLITTTAHEKLNERVPPTDSYFDYINALKLEIIDLYIKEIKAELNQIKII